MKKPRRLWVAEMHNDQYVSYSNYEQCATTPHLNDAKIYVRRFISLPKSHSVRAWREVRVCLTEAIT